MCQFVLVFSVLLVLRLPRLGKRELILVLFVRLFDLCLFGYVGFLFLLGSGKGCGVWHSLDFSLTFFWNSWKTTPFDWWQCQMNFAVWCATAGCGFSVEDHLQTKDPLLAGLYRFHVYYTTRRLLVELKVPLPGDKSYSWYKNAYDARAYKRLCTEVGVAPSTDWRQKLDHGCQGLGSWSTYMEPSRAYRHAYYSDGPFFHPKDSIRHNRDFSRAWTMFIPDASECFTQAGVERHPGEHKALSENAPICIDPSGLRPGWGSTSPRATWPSTRAMSRATTTKS